MGSWTDRDEWRWAGENNWRDNEPRHFRSTSERGVGERMREGLREVGERVKDAFDPDRDGRWGSSEPRHGRESSYHRDRIGYGQSQWSPRDDDALRYGYAQRAEYHGRQWPEREPGSRMGHGAEFQYPIARDPAFEWGREDYGRGRDLRIPQSGSMLGEERWGSGILEDERSRYRAAQGVDRPSGRRDPLRTRAPKGYRRPDTTILDEVCLALGHDVDVDATEIEVEVQGGEVTLKGTVETRDQKRWAENLAEGIRGVIDVHNQLRVRSSLLDRAVEKVKDAFGVERAPDRRPG